MKVEIIRIYTESVTVRYRFEDVEKLVPVRWVASTGWRITGAMNIPPYIAGPVNEELAYYAENGARAKDGIYVDEKPVIFNPSGSKYLREIRTTADGRIDVYAVLQAFDVTCPARQHAIKKLLCSGLRGKGSEKQDVAEALDAVQRAVDLC